MTPEEFMAKDVAVYAVGLVHCSACARGDISREEVARAANAAYPTGVTPWTVSEKAAFADGTPNPCPCPDYPGRVHYLLSC